MTREEAIERLNNAKGCPILYDSHREAIDMAISALEQDKLWASQETVLDQLDQSINILDATDRIKAMRGET